MPYAGMKAKINLGEYGLLTDIAPDKAPPNSLIRATNICYFNGAVQKAPGALQWNATAVSAGIVGTHYYLPTLVQPRFLAVTSDGNIYKGQDRVFGSPINSTIASTLTPNVVFADGGAEQAGNPRKCFIFTGGATLPYVLSGDGTACTVIAGPAVDWTSTSTYPKFGLIHRGQLWAFAGQISYASNALNHEQFNNVTTGLVNPVYPGEGGELLGGFVFKSKLFCFKDGGFVYSLNDSDTSQTNWYWQKVASNFGIPAPNAVAEVLDDMLTGNTYGTLTSYAATLSLGSVAAGDVMQLCQFDTYMRGYTSKSGVTVEHLLYYPEKKLLFMTSRSMYLTQNDTLIVLDYGRSGNPRPAVWQKGSPQCLALYKDINKVQRPMYGGADGHLYLVDYGNDRLEGSVAYQGAFQFQHTDLSFLDPTLSSATKQFDFLTVHYIPDGSGTLSADIYIDGRYTETVTIPMVQYQSPQLGTLVLDVNRMAAGNTESALVPIHGAGRTISAYFYDAGTQNQSFQVTGVTIYFRGGGDQAQQVSSTGG